MRGLPIIGDRKYGDFQSNKLFIKCRNEISNSKDDKSKVVWDRLFLHSASIKFSYCYERVNFSFEVASDIPDSYRSILQSIPK